MADRLGRQFSALTTINEIDQAILSSLETEPIVDTVFNQMRKLIACDGVSVSLLETHDAQTLRPTSNRSIRATRNWSRRPSARPKRCMRSRPARTP